MTRPVHDLMALGPAHRTALRAALAHIGFGECRGIVEPAEG